MNPSSDLEEVYRDRILPDAMLRDAMSAERTFLSRHGDTQLLLIKLGLDMQALEAGLHGSDSAVSLRVQPSTRAMSFETAVLDHDQLDAFELPEFSGEEVRIARLRWLLRNDRYFVLALRKRTLDGTFADRISVGRSSTKDVVLRHPNVSKNHAWFEVDGNGGLYIADADSTNHTQLNGTRLEPRELMRVQSGDHLRIGAVECVPCDPGEFWRAIRAE